MLRQVVSKARFSNIDQLVEIIRAVGRKLVDAQPKGRSGPTTLDRQLIVIPGVRVHGRKHRSQSLASHSRRISYGISRDCSPADLETDILDRKVCFPRTAP